MEQVAAFYGYQEALQIADLAACKHTAHLCPSLTRNSIFVPPGTAFGRADPPQEQTPGHSQQALLSSSPFSGYWVFLFLSPFPGISPCSSHGSSPGGSMEDLQLLDSLYPALLRQDPAGFSLQRLLRCCKTQASGRMQKRQRWCLIFYFASRFLSDGVGDRARGTAGVGKVEKRGEKSRKQPR